MFRIDAGYNEQNTSLPTFPCVHCSVTLCYGLKYIADSCSLVGVENTTHNSPIIVLSSLDSRFELRPPPLSFRQAYAFDALW